MEHNRNLVLYLRRSTFKKWVPELSALLTIQGLRYRCKFSSKAGKKKHLKKALWMYFAGNDFRGEKKSSLPFFYPICMEQLESCPMPNPYITATCTEPTSHCSASGICSVTPLLPCSLQSEVIGMDQPTWLLTTLPRILCELKWVIAPRKATASGTCAGSFVCVLQSCWAGNVPQAQGCKVYILLSEGPRSPHMH